MLPQPLQSETDVVTAQHLRDGIDHVKSHLHTAMGVISLGLGEARHTVVAVPKDLDAATVVFLWGKHSTRSLQSCCW